MSPQTYRSLFLDVVESMGQNLILQGVLAALLVYQILSYAIFFLIVYMGQNLIPGFVVCYPINIRLVVCYLSHNDLLRATVAAILGAQERDNPPRARRRADSR